MLDSFFVKLNSVLSVGSGIPFLNCCSRPSPLDKRSTEKPQCMKEERDVERKGQGGAPRGAIGGKNGKTAVLPGFCKIK